MQRAYDFSTLNTTLQLNLIKDWVTQWPPIGKIFVH